MSIPSKINKNHRWFEEQINHIYDYSNDLLHGLSFYKNVNEIEKRIIIESLVLRVCALWESFIEKELILCSNEDITKLIESYDLDRNSRIDESIIKALIFSNRFIKFGDIDNIKGMFNKVAVQQNNPIVKISPKQKGKIEFAYLLRNYLSHYSTYAKKKLKNSYGKKYNQRKFIEPGIFLSKSKGKIFFDLVQQFKFASINMKKLWA